MKYSGAGLFINRYLENTDTRKDVLDCGCGAGVVSNYLLKKGFNVYAMDISLTSLRMTREPYGLKGMHASNLCLPFKDDFFDVVISSGVVHHTPDAKKSVGELTRVLKPGGLLYLLIYRRESLQYWEYKTIGALLRKMRKSPAGRYFVDYVIVPAAAPLVYVAKSVKFRTFESNRLEECKNYLFDRY
ncbi:MAG: class I SAM-dependent methyltransferase, partial [Candidatus Omnitrophica bacterium]|nr:class I SAM-dependent methyltransferase [Candidatus Omnitrophota bacterium]